MTKGSGRLSANAQCFGAMLLWAGGFVSLEFLLADWGRAVAERSALCGQRRISSDMVVATGGSTSSQASVLVERAFYWGSRLGSRFNLFVSGSEIV